MVERGSNGYLQWRCCGGPVSFLSGWSLGDCFQATVCGYFTDCCGCMSTPFCSSYLGHCCFCCSFPCRMPLSAMFCIFGAGLDLLMLATCCGCCCCRYSKEESQRWVGSDCLECAAAPSASPSYGYMCIARDGPTTYPIDSLCTCLQVWCCLCVSFEQGGLPCFCKHDKPTMVNHMPNIPLMSRQDQ